MTAVSIRGVVSFSLIRFTCVGFLSVIFLISWKFFVNRSRDFDDL